MSLFLITINSCKTLPEVKIELPIEPQRKELIPPTTLKEYAQIIAYYDELVQEWELWAKTTKEIISTQNQ